MAADGGVEREDRGRLERLHPEVVRLAPGELLRLVEVREEAGDERDGDELVAGGLGRVAAVLDDDLLELAGEERLDLPAVPGPEELVEVGAVSPPLPADAGGAEVGPVALHDVLRPGDDPGLGAGDGPGPPAAARRVPQEPKEGRVLLDVGEPLALRPDQEHRSRFPEDREVVPPAADLAGGEPDPGRVAREGAAPRHVVPPGEGAARETARRTRRRGRGRCGGGSSSAPRGGAGSASPAARRRRARRRSPGRRPCRRSSSGSTPAPGSRSRSSGAGCGTGSSRPGAVAASGGRRSREARSRGRRAGSRPPPRG